MSFGIFHKLGVLLVVVFVVGMVAVVMLKNSPDKTPVSNVTAQGLAKHMRC